MILGYIVVLMMAMKLGFWGFKFGANRPCWLVRLLSPWCFAGGLLVVSFVVAESNPLYDVCPVLNNLIAATGVCSMAFAGTAFVASTLSSYNPDHNALLPRDNKAQINDLFRNGDEALRNRAHSRAGDFYREACDVCVQTVKVDSPFMAAALNRLAMARIGDGYFTHAQELLDRAELIMGEWPDQDQWLHESIARNQSKCREERGF